MSIARSFFFIKRTENSKGNKENRKQQQNRGYSMQFFCAVAETEPGTGSGTGTGTADPSGCSFWH